MVYPEHRCDDGGAEINAGESGSGKMILLLLEVRLDRPTVTESTLDLCFDMDGKDFISLPLAYCRSTSIEYALNAASSFRRLTGAKDDTRPTSGSV